MFQLAKFIGKTVRGAASLGYCLAILLLKDLCKILNRGSPFWELAVGVEGLSEQRAFLPDLGTSWEFGLDRVGLA